MKIPTPNELRQIALAVAVALFICAGYFAWRAYTSDPPPPMGDGAKVEEINLGEDRMGERLLNLTDSVPSVALSAWLFQGEFQSPRDYQVGAGDAIEFVPLATDRMAHPPQMRVEFDVDGRRIELARVPMGAVPGLGVPASAEILNHAIRLDLTAIEGLRGRFVWVVEGEVPPPSAIACFKYSQARLASRPSVLLICSDTHRYDYSVGGLGRDMMPMLTRLADQSVVYDRAFSTASWTLPSVASVLTGRYPRYHLTGHRIRSGLTPDLDRDRIPPGNFVAIWGPTYHQLTTYPQQLRSLPQLMRAAGYTTVLICANALISLSGLHADGFDVVFNAPLMPAPSLNYLAQSVLESLPQDRPLFLYVHYLDVHEYVERHKLKLAGEDPPSAPKRDFYPYVEPPDVVRGAYASVVREFDADLGVLLELWNEHRGVEDSMTVFYSDHGEHLFDPGHPDLNSVMVSENSEFPVSFVALQVPVLNHGNSMDETLMHVPLVVRYPSRFGIEPMREMRNVSLVDIMPTILNVAGVDADLSDLDWKSLIPGDERGTAGEPRCLFADFQLYGDERSSVRRNQFKLTLNLTEPESRLWGDPDSVLVDTSLPRDRGESGMRVENGDETADLSGVFGGYAALAAEKTRGISSDHSPDVDATTRELKRLGYIQ